MCRSARNTRPIGTERDETVPQAGAYIDMTS